MNSAYKRFLITRITFSDLPKAVLNNKEHGFIVCIIGTVFYAPSILSKKKLLNIVDKQDTM